MHDGIYDWTSIAIFVPEPGLPEIRHVISLPMMAPEVSNFDKRPDIEVELDTRAPGTPIPGMLT